MGTLALSDFIPGLQYDLPNVPQPQLINGIRQVIQEFCRHTQVWQDDLGPITINAWQSDYPLSFDDGQGQSGTVRGIMYVEVNGYKIEPIRTDDMYDYNRHWRHSINAGTPIRYLMPEVGIMRLTPTPYISVVGVTGGQQDNAWVGGNAYILNDLVYDTNGNQQKCTTAGTSGSSVPTWNTLFGGTTADGATLVWTNTGAEPVVNPAGVNICQVFLQPDINATLVPDVLEDWLPVIQDGVRVKMKAYLKPELRDNMIEEFKNRYRSGKNECRILTIGEAGIAPQVEHQRFAGSI
jgi:hypothetical protein